MLQYPIMMESTAINNINKDVAFMDIRYNAWRYH